MVLGAGSAQLPWKTRIPASKNPYMDLFGKGVVLGEAEMSDLSQPEMLCRVNLQWRVTSLVQV